mgnify:CR=1 FL=1
MGMSRSIGVVTIDLENRLPWRKEFEAHAALLNQLVNMQAALEDPFDDDTHDDIPLSWFEPTWSFWAGQVR